MIPNHNIEKWWFRPPATQSSWVKFAQVDSCFLWHTPRVFQILYNSQLIPPNHQVATKFFFFSGGTKKPTSSTSAELTPGVAFQLFVPSPVADRCRCRCCWRSTTSVWQALSDFENVWDQFYQWMEKFDIEPPWNLKHGIFWCMGKAKRKPFRNVKIWFGTSNWNVAICSGSRHSYFSPSEKWWWEIKSSNLFEPFHHFFHHRRDVYLKGTGSLYIGMSMLLSNYRL